MSVEVDGVLKAFLESEGYTDICIKNGMVCGLYRNLFTHGLMIDMDFTGLSGRFCFDNKHFAQLYLSEWDGIDMPVLGETEGLTAIKYRPKKTPD